MRKMSLLAGGKVLTNKDISNLLHKIDLKDHASKNASQLSGERIKLSQFVSVTSLTNKFSGGTARKLCVFLAFVGDQDIVLLDEPTAG
jgi:ABC-type lipoprotein export system ATPase subunit